jgi:hypothetical protein
LADEENRHGAAAARGAHNSEVTGSKPVAGIFIFQFLPNRFFARISTLAFSCFLCFVSFIFSLSSREGDATPLMFAAQEGKLDVCQFLVEHKADANAKDKKYSTSPLHLHLNTLV